MSRQKIVHAKADDRDVFYIPNTFTAFVEEQRKISNPKKDDNNKKKYSPWGENNLFPQDVVSDIEKNDLIPTLLDWKARVLFAGGLVYGTETVDETGKETIKRLIVPEIEEWLERVNIGAYLYEASLDYYTFYNIFPEIVLKASGQAVELFSHDSCQVRLAPQDSKGMIPTAFVSANWETDSQGNKADERPCLDPYYDIVSQIRSRKKLNYILPIRTLKYDRVYYDKAPWNGLRESGWLDVAQAIPKFKSALMSNKIMIKFIVKIPVDYWTAKYKTWDKQDAKKRAAIKKKELQEFTNFLKGAENAGNAFATEYKVSPTGQEFGGWKIEPVREGAKDGEYIEDSQECDFHITRALGIDPTITGIGPGKDSRSGSGSDKRVALNMYLLSEKINQDKILMPFKVIATLNDWHKHAKDGGRIKFWSKDIFLATQDLIKPENRM